MSEHDHLTHEEWAAALREGRLLGQECADCGHVAGAPKAACAHCGSREVETVELPAEGVVYSETTVAVPPDWFEERGYQVALVEVGEARLMARIDAEEEEVAIGDEVTFEGAFEEADQPAPLFSA